MKLPNWTILFIGLLLLYMTKLRKRAVITKRRNRSFPYYA